MSPVLAVVAPAVALRWPGLNHCIFVLLEGVPLLYTGRREKGQGASRGCQCCGPMMRREMVFEVWQ